MRVTYTEQPLRYSCALFSGHSFRLNVSDHSATVSQPPQFNQPIASLLHPDLLLRFPLSIIETCVLPPK